MIINELNYLESVEEEVFGGFTSRFNFNKDVDIDVDVDEDFDIDKNVNSNVDLEGNFASGEAGATASGNNTLTQGFAFTNTTGFSSESNAFAVSGTD